MKKSRVWPALTETKPQDTLQIRKTPWHGVTKQPPAVPLPPNATPERNKKNQGSGRNSTVGAQSSIVPGTISAGHRNLCTEHQKHFGVGFLDKEAVAHLMATIDTTEHAISGRAPPCCTTGSADYPTLPASRQGTPCWRVLVCLS